MIGEGVVQFLFLKNVMVKDGNVLFQKCVGQIRLSGGFKKSRSARRIRSLPTGEVT
jgi:hypothetical protein